MLYNSFTFNLSQRNYFIYKRELYIIITFYKKYDYLYKYLYKITIIFTNYKSLIYFLNSNIHEEVYDN